jgi:hypothetical protein
VNCALQKSIGGSLLTPNLGYVEQRAAVFKEPILLIA